EAEKNTRQVVALCEKIAADFPASPGGPHGLAQGHHQLADLLKETGQYRESEKSYRRAIAIREKLVTDSRGNSFNNRSGLYKSLGNLGDLLIERSELSEAEAHFQRTRALVEKLVTEIPFEHEYRRDWGITLINLGKVHRDTARYQEAEKDLQQAVAILQEQARERPTIREGFYRLA